MRRLLTARNRGEQGRHPAAVQRSRAEFARTQTVMTSRGGTPTAMIRTMIFTGIQIFASRIRYSM